MRLIDADALKDRLAKHQSILDFDWNYDGLIASIIDNAPTITPSLNLDNISDEQIQRFKMIWQRTNSKGLLVINEPCYQTTSCLDCKNYDKEKHNCPRYCEVIKEAIKSRPQGEPVIKCQDCKYQVKEWREDKRTKEKGYWVYGCEHFGEIMGYWGFGGNDNEFCSDAEQKGGAEMKSGQEVSNDD